MRLFFSHSSRDKALLREIKSYLPSWLTVWIDEEQLLLGSDLGDTLKSAINSSSDYVVLFLGKETAESTWVKKEIEWAISREEEVDRVFLLPVVLPDSNGEAVDKLGLSGRFALYLKDFSRDSTKEIAREIVVNITGWVIERLASLEHIEEINPPCDSNFDRLVGTLTSNLKSTPVEWREHVENTLLRPFLHQSAQSARGEIPLTSSQYYQYILREIRTANSETTIFAVSTLSSSLWNENVSQIDYAKKNFEALGRGCKIIRLFVLPENGHEEFRDMIMEQSKSGIDVRVAKAGLLAHVNELEDLVLFRDANGYRGYVARPSIDGQYRIRSGSLVVAPELTDKMKMAFNDAWDMALDYVDFFGGKLQVPNNVGGMEPPGLSLQREKLLKPVVTCEEAASARGIPIEQELKTLILETTTGLVAAHLPGDGILSLAKVKQYLEAEQAYLADPETLQTLGLSAGTVSALIEPVWSMPHLISKRVFEQSVMMTNDGTKTGYFSFDPVVLTHAENIRVGEFEKQVVKKAKPRKFKSTLEGD